jgi:hypothetical protein
MGKLLATEYVELIEGNNWGDTFFGVCNGEGENWLGRLLMNLRAWESEFRRLDGVVIVEMVRDFQVNDEEIITEGAIGTIRYGNTIYFPKGVINLPEGIAPEFVRYDFDKDNWKGLVKII